MVLVCGSRASDVGHTEEQTLNSIDDGDVEFRSVEEGQFLGCFGEGVGGEEFVDGFF